MFAPPKNSIQYRPAIDGMRAVAIMAVFVFHLKKTWLPGGFVGVDIFFVISGYLITSILLREYQHDSFTLVKFYQRRIARLFPAFFTVALATLVGAYFIYSSQDLASCGANLAFATLSVVNIKLIAQGNYFKLVPDSQPFLHYWSLSVEEQFYLLFPATLLFLYLKANRYRTAILAVLCSLSLLTCIALTRTKPTWAFYLLPTRAWELLAGAILADLSARPAPGYRKLWDFLALVGLALAAVSIFVIHDGPAFPGYVAILPVLGTVFVIGPYKQPSGLAERLLSWKPMAFVGRMSYSLYLWHWPVFSLVDYHLYLASPWVRIALKVGLSAALAVLCFFFIENPGRVFLNQPSRRRLAFGFLGCALLIFVPLGMGVRNANYINAEVRDVAKGGLVFNQASAKGSMILMGDSNGSMYGVTARQIADELGFKLIVISAAGVDPLPHSSGQNPAVWTESLAIVKRTKPNYLLLVCEWAPKLGNDKGKLAIAIEELKRYTNCLIMITEPPELPESCNRESIRNGSRPPFTEDPVERSARMEANAFIKSFQSESDNVIVIDIDSHFVSADGSLIFADPYGNWYYHNRDHLSVEGANLVKADIVEAMADRKSAGLKVSGGP